MKVYINILGRNIPSYGLFIVLGGTIVNIIAYFIIRRKKLDINDFILLEAYGFLGAFIGAKLLYLFVNFNEIQWHRLNSLEYISNLMQGGFVFYGGIIGGILFAHVASRIYKIRLLDYLNEMLFLIPLGHAFGRVGCFMAGCCYGIPYTGRFNVVFPENSFALSGEKLFPVQLIEALGLVIISLILYLIYNLLHFDIVVEAYMIMYGTFRLIIENYRYDSSRGIFLFLSTSQWISIVLIMIGIKLLGIKYKEKRGANL